MRRRTPPPIGIVPPAIGVRVCALHVAPQISQAELGARYVTRARGVSAVELGKISPVLTTLAYLARKVSAEICHLVARGL